MRRYICIVIALLLMSGCSFKARYNAEKNEVTALGKGSAKVKVDNTEWEVDTKSDGLFPPVTVKQ